MEALLLAGLAVLAVAGVWLLARLARGHRGRRERTFEASEEPRSRDDPDTRERGFEMSDGKLRELETGEPAAGGGAAAGPAVEPVQFTVFHPQELIPGRWAKLLAYVHLADARDRVEEDRDRQLAGEPPVHRERASEAVLPIARGAAIRVVPELPGCRFNPPEASLLWLEDWHVAPFRVQAHPEAPGFEAGRAVNGRVAFFVETVLVGEVAIWALLSDRDELPDRPLAPTAPADPFEKVFVSYSHRDGEIVASLGRAYRALGMRFLRDVDELRSGERWNPRLLELIEEADLFQLYWSEAAARSDYVAQEWRHALAQERDRFVRPLYWRKPMPPPPDELRAIHFAYLPGLEAPPDGGSPDEP